MVVGDLPVDAGIAVKAASEELPVYVSFVLEDKAVACGALAVAGRLRVTQLAGGVALVVYSGEDVHAAGAVVDVYGAEGVVARCPPERLGVGCVKVEAEAVALPAYGLDSHHAAHGGIVLGSGVGNDFDALYLVALEALQLAAVRDFASVDVNERGALAYDFKAVAASDEARSLGQDVRSRTCVLKYRAAHVGLKALAGEFRLWHDGLDGGAFEHGGVFYKGDGHAVHGREIFGLIAQDGDHHYAVGFFGADVFNYSLFIQPHDFLIPVSKALVGTNVVFPQEQRHFQRKKC